MTSGTGTTVQIDYITQLPKLTRVLLGKVVERLTEKAWLELCGLSTLKNLGTDVFDVYAKYIPDSVWKAILVDAYDDMFGDTSIKLNKWVRSKEFLLNHAVYITDDGVWDRLCSLRSMDITPMFIERYSGKIDPYFWDYVLRERGDTDVEYGTEGDMQQELYPLKFLLKYVHMFTTCSWRYIFRYRKDLDEDFLRVAAKYFNKRMWRTVCKHQQHLLSESLLREYAEHLDEKCWERIAVHIRTFSEQFLRDVSHRFSLVCWDKLLSLDSAETISEQFIRDHMHFLDEDILLDLIMCKRSIALSTQFVEYAYEMFPKLQYLISGLNRKT